MRSPEEKKEIQRSLEQLKTEFSLSNEELLTLLQEQSLFLVPVQVFSTRQLSGLQALVTHLKEKKEFTYSKIGQLLGRDQRTIWTAYHQAKRRTRRVIESSLRSSETIPLSLFRNRNASILEHIVVFLKGKKYTTKGIAQLLQRSPTTISTALGRAMLKGVRP